MVMSPELLKKCYSLEHIDGYELKTNWVVDRDGDIWVERADGGKISYTDPDGEEPIEYDGVYLNIEASNYGYAGVKDFPVKLVTRSKEIEEIKDTENIIGFGIL